MNAAKLDSGRLVQGLILFGFNIYLIKMLASGDVYKLLSPLAANLLLATVVVMIVMMAYCLLTMRKKETGHEHDHGHAHDHARAHAHDHACGHDHAHDHHHACGHDHAHDHHHACGHDHAHDHHHACGHDHAHGHDHADCGHDHDHNPKPRLSWAIIAVPMLLGLAVPTQSLGSSMMSSGLQVAPAQVQLINEVPAEDTAQAKTNTTNTNTNSTATSATPQQTAASAQPQKQEEVKPLGSVGASSYKTDFTKVPRAKGPMPEKPQPGKELKMNDMAAGIAVAPEFYYEQRFKFVGMVFRPEGFPENRFILLRYMIAHCSADSTAIGLVVETKDASKYQNDQWVEVNATITLQKAPDFDQLAPIAWFQGYPYKPMLIGHDVQTIEAPKYPYLYSTFKI